MTTGFTKLFSSIITSTIWQEPNETRIVWITMLAVADRSGDVMSSLPGLASIAHVSREQCERALATLSSPDQYSRTTQFEGRRIEPIDGGWHLLNHAKYRAAFSADERREYKRLKQRQYRHPEAVHNSPRGQVRTDVDTMQRQSTERKKETKKETSTLSTPNVNGEHMTALTQRQKAESSATAADSKEQQPPLTEEQRAANRKRFAEACGQTAAALKAENHADEQSNAEG